MMIGILGASGLIGYNLYKFLSDKREVLGTYFSKPREGLVRFNLLTDDFSLFDKCSHVVIAAAVTNIDQCFLNNAAAYRFNVEKTIEFICYLAKKQIKPVFISSDQVFDGHKGNYKEDDLPVPVNSYGVFKLQVEEFMKNNLTDYLILRLSKTYSRDLDDGGMFAEIFLKLKKADILKVAYNQIFNPTDVKNVSHGIYLSINRGLCFTYHLADKKIMSRYAFAQTIASEFGFDQKLIKKIDFNCLQFLEKRALNSSLNVEKFYKAVDFDAQSAIEGQ